MKNSCRLLNALFVVIFVVTGCTVTTPTAVPPTALPPTTVPPTALPQAPTTAPATPAADPNVLYVALVWHQHQPLYYKNADGVYTRPWVRVHGTKDYYDMAATVAKYPDVHVTFNLTPVLLKQLDDFVVNGAKDYYWVLAEKPAADLDDADKDFLLRRFFDANWDHIIRVHPGYKALLDKRGGTTEEAIAAAMTAFTEQDFRDLQVWFNLAWFDPSFLEQDPLKALVAKDHGFSEADKAVLFGEVTRVLAQIVPLHKQLQDAGQIEVITTPYAHPILPLIYNTGLALVGNPEAEMPERFSYPNDAIAHLDRSVEIYQAHFGQAPRGMWPGEGSVAQDIVPLVSRAGYQWMASGEQVLAQSLGIGAFTRDSNDTVQEADQLYRPYFVQGTGNNAGGPVMMVFRDLRISDKVGFEYSQTPGQQAADDLMQRLANIQAELKDGGAKGPHLVSIILDGENAWENYDHDGIEFLNALYANFAKSTTVKTVTPSEYLAMFPEQQKIDDLFPGAWFSPNYDTWIGESEEATAWNYLVRTRAELAKFDMLKQKTAPSPEALAQAIDYMYLAEGSDWFWWYGTDQDSGNDAYFDEGYRALLAKVFESLGEDVPAFVKVPIIPARVVAPQSQVNGMMTPAIDGQAGADEWANAAYFPFVGGAQARSEDVAAGLYYGLDTKYLYVRVDAKDAWAAIPDPTVELYVSSPRLPTSLAITRRTQASSQPTLLGFGATTLGAVDLAAGTLTLYGVDAKQGWVAGVVTTTGVAAADSVLEFAVPLSAFGEVEAGDDLRVLAVVGSGERDLQLLPTGGPGQLVLPDISNVTPILDVQDPLGDDHGPGTYTYPTDSVFVPGVFDLAAFSVGYDEKTMVFKFTFNGPVPNPWGSGNNLSVQTLDVYVDTDPGAGTGARLLMPGRNAALESGNGWDYAVWAEGWTPSFVMPDDAGKAKQVGSVAFKVLVDPAKQTVTLRVPRSAFGEGDPTTWGYAAMVMSQDGFPASGVWRIRDGLPTAEQWRFGGVPAGATNYPRMLDLIWPAEETPSQEDQLGKYTVATVNVDGLTPDDFALIKLLLVQ